MAKSYQVQQFLKLVERKQLHLVDGDYIADVPDFKYISAFGDTPEEALHEVLIALESAIETLRQQGKPLPEAIYRPAYRTE
jgi:predicted RNase H-like HicB family nuclease